LVALDVKPRRSTPGRSRVPAKPLRRMLYFDELGCRTPVRRGDRGDGASIEAHAVHGSKLAAFVSRHKDACRIRFGQDKWLLRQR
jgi:hypothetical protein